MLLPAARVGPRTSSATHGEDRSIDHQSPRELRSAEMLQQHEEAALQDQSVQPATLILSTERPGAAVEMADLVAVDGCSACSAFLRHSTRESSSCTTDRRSLCSPSAREGRSGDHVASANGSQQYPSGASLVGCDRQASSHPTTGSSACGSHGDIACGETGAPRRMPLLTLVRTASSNRDAEKRLSDWRLSSMAGGGGRYPSITRLFKKRHPLRLSSTNNVPSLMHGQSVPGDMWLSATPRGDASSATRVATVDDSTASGPASDGQPDGQPDGPLATGQQHPVLHKASSCPVDGIRQHEAHAVAKAHASKNGQHQHGPSFRRGSLAPGTVVGGATETGWARLRRLRPKTVTVNDANEGVENCAVLKWERHEKIGGRRGGAEENSTTLDATCLAELQKVSPFARP